MIWVLHDVISATPTLPHPINYLKLNCGKKYVVVMAWKPHIYPYIFKREDSEILQPILVPTNNSHFISSVLFCSSQVDNIENFSNIYNATHSHKQSSVIRLFSYN